MRHNKVRGIIRDSKKTQEYESRDSIRRKNRVNQIVWKVASDLAGVEDDLVNKAEIEKVVDKYYQPDEMPSADAITEMMGWDNPKCKWVVVGAAAVLVGLFFYCRH
jgi:hypothetical protein